MKIPFSVEAFYGVFTAYNNTVWPMQIPLLVFGLLALSLLINQRRFSSAGISLILTVLWLWQALAYHLAFFSVINPLAYGFAAVFMLGAVVFFWLGVVRKKLKFNVVKGWRKVAGFSLILFSILIYPLWSYLSGHRYPAFPTFGLPCPTTIFTIGLLAFLVKPYPRSVFIVPILWCFVGSQAAFVFDLSADLGLIVAGALGLILIVRSTESPIASKEHSNQN